jgi:hypothetical protein
MNKFNRDDRPVERYELGGVQGRDPATDHESDHLRAGEFPRDAAQGFQRLGRLESIAV